MKTTPHLALINQSAATPIAGMGDCPINDKPAELVALAKQISGDFEYPAWKLQSGFRWMCDRFSNLPRFPQLRNPVQIGKSALRAMKSRCSSSAPNRMNLARAIPNYLDKWPKHSGLTPQLQHNGLDQVQASPEIATSLSPILQKALNDISSDARAPRVNSVLAPLGKDLFLVVEDNSVGPPRRCQADAPEALGC